jgi:hypothetical protein
MIFSLTGSLASSYRSAGNDFAGRMFKQVSLVSDVVNLVDISIIFPATKF